jgi:hypothetical protein
MNFGLSNNLHLVQDIFDLPELKYLVERTISIHIYILNHWIEIAVSKGPNYVGVFPSPEDGNSFWNVMFYIF